MLLIFVSITHGKHSSESATMSNMIKMGIEILFIIHIRYCLVRKIKTISFLYFCGRINAVIYTNSKATKINETAPVQFHSIPYSVHHTHTHIFPVKYSSLLHCCSNVIHSCGPFSILIFIIWPLLFSFRSVFFFLFIFRLSRKRIYTLLLNFKCCVASRTRIISLLVWPLIHQNSSKN